MFAVSAFMAFSVFGQEQYNARYPFDPDKQVNENVLKGEILHFTLDSSRIYPGTVREYWVYVPAQYDASKPACLHFNFDGIQFNAPTVFDNLIYKGELPVIIGVFMAPGNVKDNEGKLFRPNRSYEFDAMNDDMVNFIETELLPDVEKHTTSDGRPIRISKDAKDRSIAGASSGGIAAFTAAWERPDRFSRVFSAIGSFTGMRGGDGYPVLVRKTEPKSIRVFLEDGRRDAWNPLFGDWFKGNVDLEAALNFAGYEVNHQWSERGGHDGIQATEIFPDAMRWLWRGWPAPVANGPTGNDQQKEILVPGKTWKLSSSDITSAVGMTSDKEGNVFFSDMNGKTYKLNHDGSISETDIDIPHGAVTTTSGMSYMINKGGKNRSDYGFASIELKQGKRYVKVVENLWAPEAMVLSSDERMMYVSDNQSRWINTYLVEKDGTLKYGQRWCWLHTPERTDGMPDMSEAKAMAIDVKGNLYVATTMGVQVCDSDGKVRTIMSLPEGAVTDLCFGGKDLSVLYIICNGRIYQRDMNVSGIAR